MRRRKSLIAGIVCGLLCAAAILLYAQELHAAVEAERAESLARFGGEQVEVYVATKDIAAGEMVSSSNSEKRLWVGELLPEDAVLDLASVEGKTLSSPVYAGEVVSLRRFRVGDAPALQVPEGLCAVSVPSKSVSAVGGSVKAGSTVDVYATSGTATERIASSVLVLSTSATSTEGDDGGDADISWVTLAVAPDLVQELISAAQKTELYFVLPSEGAADAGGEGAGGDGQSSGASSWSPDSHTSVSDEADAEEGASGETSRGDDAEAASGSAVTFEGLDGQTLETEQG